MAEGETRYDILVDSEGNPAPVVPSYVPEPRCADGSIPEEYHELSDRPRDGFGLPEGRGEIGLFNVGQEP